MPPPSCRFGLEPVHAQFVTDRPRLEVPVKIALQVWLDSLGGMQAQEPYPNPNEGNR